MAPNPRKNSRGGRISREKYSGETSPTKIEILAEMVERLFMQESLCSLPGSVPSGPQDGLIGKPLCQEDLPPFRTHDEPPKTVEDFRAKSNLGRQKTLLRYTAIGLKEKQNIVLRMARTGTELVLFNDGRMGDVATGIGGTLVLPPLNVDYVNLKSRDFQGF